MSTRILRYFDRRMSHIEYVETPRLQVSDERPLINVSFNLESYMIKCGDYLSATATPCEMHDGKFWVLRDEQ
jgi:hypothetical protein